MSALLPRKQTLSCISAQAGPARQECPVATLRLPALKVACSACVLLVRTRAPRRTAQQDGVNASQQSGCAKRQTLRVLVSIAQEAACRQVFSPLPTAAATAAVDSEAPTSTSQCLIRRRCQALLHQPMIAPCRPWHCKGDKPANTHLP